VTLTRRGFLAATVALAATACSRGGDAGGGSSDLDLATTAARMERVATDTYTDARNTLVQGGLGAAIPQAVVELVTAAGGHHKAHLDAWNRLLTAGGRAVVDAPDPKLRPAVDEANRRVADIPALAGLALRLEDYISRTYLRAIPTLQEPDTIRLAAQILVVDQQHQAVLRYLLGLPVVPDAFAPSDPSLDLLTR
jgi:hypothetical protein